MTTSASPPPWSVCPGPRPRFDEIDLELTKRNLNTPPDQVVGMLYRHDSPALEHGVKSGDILHFVNGEPVHGQSEEFVVNKMLRGTYVLIMGHFRAG
jgi:C-terminal processing protease CtpA/Prc